MEHEKKKDGNELSKSTCVRFSDDEFKRIKRDAALLGRTIPWLLKETYFKGEIESPILIKEDAMKIMTALARIGNNLNQIARKLNSNFREGFHDGITDALSDLESMKMFIGGAYGSR